ncbi:MAG: SatD family protein [Bacillota bacterium]
MTDRIKLNVNDFQKAFRNTHQINESDLSSYYKKHLGQFSTYHKSDMINQLINEKIIFPVSRTEYRLNRQDNTEQLFVLMTLDIVASSKVPPEKLDARLRDKLDQLNSVLEQVFHIKRQFHLSRGDEIQIILPYTDQLNDLIILTFAYLYPFKVRYVLSFGIYNGELKDNSWDMNGPIFWQARKGFDDLKEKSAYAGTIVTGIEERDKMYQDILSAINLMISQITDKQWEAIKYHFGHIGYETATKAIGISKTSYYKRIDTSSIHVISRSLAALLLLVTK